MGKVDTLFGSYQADPPVSRRGGPRTSREADRAVSRSGRRVSAKQRLLQRLRRGPATSYELAMVTIKFTARISDLRADGCEIHCKVGENGSATYLLVGEPR